MNKQTIHNVLAASQAGEMTFPEVVRGLMAQGVESYFVDFGSARETLYFVDGSTWSESMALAAGAVSDNYAAARLIEAIRGAQMDTIRYPEFVRLAKAAGVVGYWAFLTGRKVVYFGRKGEMHTELFPSANA